MASDDNHLLGGARLAAKELVELLEKPFTASYGKTDYEATIGRASLLTDEVMTLLTAWKRRDG